MGLPTGVEGKESGKGDESAEETEQKPVVVAPPPVVETVSAPSAASPPADQSSEVSTAQRGEMLLGFPGGRAGDVPKSALSCLHGAQAAGQSSLRGEGTRGRHQGEGTRGRAPGELLPVLSPSNVVQSRRFGSNSWSLSDEALREPNPAPLLAECEATGTNPDQARQEPGDGAEREEARAEVRAHLRDGRQPRQALRDGGEAPSLHPPLRSRPSWVTRARRLPPASTRSDLIPSQGGG